MWRTFLELKPLMLCSSILHHIMYVLKEVEELVECCVCLACLLKFSFHFVRNGE